MNTNFNHKTLRNGFTLIEILIVIAIIGILSSVILASLSIARKKARDTKRLLDMKQIKLALELYLDSNNQYPGSVASYGEGSTCGGWDTSRLDSDNDGKPFIEPLIDKEIIPAVPTDPLDSSGNACGGYDYYRYNAGSNGCPVSNGFFFVLGVRDMETSGRPHPASPGWKCTGRNWQSEFDYVTGGFEK